MQWNLNLNRPSRILKMLKWGKASSKRMNVLSECAHLNDLENIPAFLLAAFFYILSEPDVVTALVLIRIAVIARFIHTIVSSDYGNFRVGANHHLFDSFYLDHRCMQSTQFVSQLGWSASWHALWLRSSWPSGQCAACFKSKLLRIAENSRNISKFNFAYVQCSMCNYTIQ